MKLKRCNDCGSIVCEGSSCPACGSVRLSEIKTDNVYCESCNKVFVGTTTKCPACKNPTKSMQDTVIVVSAK